MKKLELTKENRRIIYDKVESMTAHSDIYFPDHVRQVARNCFVYANHLSKSEEEIDPIICELGGLLHDIGYTKEFEPEEKDHIIKGVKIAPKMLKEINIKENYIEKIIDTIWTHDGNLKRTRYEKIPTNNKIVNDVDAMQFFDWPLPSLIEFVSRLKPEKSEKDIILSILSHSYLTFEYIHLNYFQELATPKLEDRIKRLEKILLTKM